MWTPKRVLILLGGFAFFSTLFGVYLQFLGYIDGLPELPPNYTREQSGNEAPPPLIISSGHDVKIFQDAFGDGCPELDWPTRLYWRSKGLAFSTKKFEIDKKDKRVKLSPFSAIIFGKTTGNGFPEINTVKSDFAYLTLDRPVEVLSEINNRKIVEIELAMNPPVQGKDPEPIKIRNNHRSRQTTDDIEVSIVNASLFYNEERGLIWSEGLVTILDFKTSPETKVTAQGMQIKLAKEGTPSKSKSASKKDGVSGVELVLLKKNVRMHLYMDPQSGFLAEPQGADKSAASVPSKSAAPAEKAHVIISTDGPFDYDLTLEQAHFLCDKTSPANPEVVVTREHKDEQGSRFDSIYCEKLDLQFHKKAPTASSDKAGKDTGSDKEIDTALATGREVRISMESEHLEAVGAELFFRSAGETKGPQTVIKGRPGQPMCAIKDGHKILAPELHLVGADKNGRGQQAEAHGAGRIDMFDSAKKSYPQHAIWRDEMSVLKIVKNGVPLDLIILKGAARFEDDERQQTLRAQEQYVWLEPAGNKKEPTAAAVKGQQQGPMGSSNLKLHRLEANREVNYVGPDLHIESCETLIITSRDGPPKKLPEGPGSSMQPKGGGSSTAPPSDGGTGGDSRPMTSGAEPPQNKKNRPIKLWAKKVRVSVLHSGSQHDMETVTAEDDVHVIQEGETAKDKGIDIQGSVLNLVQREHGKILCVDGDDKGPPEKKCGRLLMNDMLLVAPRISINQEDNLAQGEGQGYLNMPSNANLDGTKTAKPGARMTVHWNKRMEFNGRNANFFGGVQAVQEHSNLKCQNLQVTMDREVSFKEGQKDTQTAKIEKILCERQVFVLERVVDERTGQLLRQQQGEFRQLDVDNIDGRTSAAGPGYVASFSKDGPDPKVSQKLTKAKAGEQPKLTRVEFVGRLSSVTRENTRKSTFYDYVEVYHLPAARPDVAINKAVPPKDGFYLRCQLLEIYSRPVGGKNAQNMEAKRQVTFQTDEFFGRADIVKFDEADDIIVFEANPGNIVTITKIQNGRPGHEIRGNKILYNRKTGEFNLGGVREIRGQG